MWIFLLYKSFFIVFLLRSKIVKDYKKAAPRYVLIHITADESFLKKHQDRKAAEEYVESLIKGVRIFHSNKC